jgi:hypothetical protein
MTESNRRGGLLAIGFAALALVGLALWFNGANMPEPHDSAADLADRLHDRPLALAGASLLILSMVVLLAYSRWLAMHHPGNTLVLLGSAGLALGALTHLIENAIVLGVYSGDIATHDKLAPAIGLLSNTAFGLLGLGTLIAAFGLHPAWLKLWGIVTGLLGLEAASEYVTDLGLPPVFNASLLVWLIVVGFRTGERDRSSV